MKKFVCTVCGYVYEGEAAPEKCPVCGVGADKFKEQTGEREWAAEHVVGVKLDYTMKKLHGKKLSTLLNSQNFLAKLLQTAQRRTLRCV